MFPSLSGSAAMRPCHGSRADIELDVVMGRADDLPLVCTVSTVKDTLHNVEAFVGRNLAAGVDHMFVFLDAPDPETQFVARPASPHHRDPHRRGLLGRGAARQPQRASVIQRQSRQLPARPVRPGALAVPHRR